MQPYIAYTFLFISGLIQIIGILLFANGFFPYKTYLPGFADPSLDIPKVPGREENEIVEPHFDRLVLVLVDALRNDFVFGENSGFEFVKSLISNNSALPYTAYATSPTVTLPRIKALTTGTVPSFLDAILNIAESDTTSSLVRQDNWLYQFHTAGRKKIHFFGDDTWIKLFPGLFSRHEGTTSFYVTDTQEVDKNVTRHIKSELGKMDWDVLILHYLGLDHIGHSGGPNSPLMKPKQIEMDEVVQVIYEHVVKDDKLRREKNTDRKETLFVLCGDHGMNEAGNHGGSSNGEVSSAFVFMSPNLQRQEIRYNPPRDVDGFGNPIINQVDIVPTLSSLFGVPIPKNSLGCVMIEVFQDRDILRVLQLNAHQLLSIFASTDSQVASWLRNADQLLDLEKSFPDCTSISHLPAKLSCTYYLAVMKHTATLHDQKEHVYNNATNNVTAESIAEIAWLYQSVITQASDVLSATASNYNLSAMFKGVFLMAIAAGYLCWGFFAAWNDNEIQNLVWGVEQKFIFGGVIAYCITLFASSFIEEEHLFWYFVVQSLWTLQFLASLSYLPNTKQLLQTVSAPLLQLFLFRLIRSWNQTGQKRIGEMDLRYYLTSTHPGFMWHLFIGTLFMILVLHHLSLFKIVPKILMFVSTILVISCKFDLEHEFGVPKAYLKLLAWIPSADSSTDRVLKARIVYVSFALYIFALLIFRWSGHKRQNHNQTYLNAFLFPITLLLIFLSRPHNAPLFLLFHFQRRLLIFWLNSIKHLNRPNYLTAFTLFSLTHASFYALGNSNSISSIDLSNAYIGVDGYQIGLVGLLTFLSNWAGPIWWAISAAGIMENGKSLLIHLVMASTFYALTILFLSISVMVLRDHLFIWTVFSPRYLYQIAWNVGFCWGVLLLCTLGTFFFGAKQKN